MNRTVVVALGTLGVFAVAIATGIYFYNSKRKANMTVTCLELDHLHSNLGVLNVPAYSLGKVLLLDSASNKAQGFMTLATTDADLAGTAAPQDTFMKLETQLDMKFDADVPKAVKAEASTTLGNVMSVELKGLVRTELANPYVLANANADLKTQIKALGGSRAVVLVSTIKKVDSLRIKLSEDAQVKSSADVLQVGNYEISVTYKCDGLYKAQGRQTGVFYGVASLAYDPATASIVPGEPVDVWKFDHAQAFE